MYKKGSVHMTEEIKKETKISVFSFVWFVALSIFFISLGVKISCIGGYSVTFNNYEYESIKDMLVSVSIHCAADIAMFLLITISARPYMTIASASLVLMLRALALGFGASFCAENAVSSVSVAMMISYAMISVLLLLYAIFINRIKSGAAVRLGLYLLTTGAAVLLRALPMMLV